MAKFKWRLIFFGVAFILLSAVNALDDYIYWSEVKPLTSSDFKGRPDLSNGMKAMTHSGIAYSWQCDNGTLSYEVIARFDRSKSWMKPGAEKFLLAHEQKHFDITEIFARKMKKVFSEMENPCRKGAALDAAAEKIYQEWDSTQNRYDSETEHGLNETEQKRWELWVAEQLESLQEFAE